MAIGYARMAVGKGSAGASASAHAQYISATQQYEHKRGVALVESRNLPSWAESAQDFWGAADQHERANGVRYRELVLALPAEMGKAENIELARDYAQTLLGDGRVYTLAVHTNEKPNKRDERFEKVEDWHKNPHVHLMWSDRKIDDFYRPKEAYFKRYNAKNPEHGGCQKDISYQVGWGQKNVRLEEARHIWQDVANFHLERNGHSARIDMRSYERQGIEKIPQVHLGHKASALEKRGVETLPGDHNRLAEETNKQLEILQEVGRYYQQTRYQISNPDHAQAFFMPSPEAVAYIDADKARERETSKELAKQVKRDRLAPEDVQFFSRDVLKQQEREVVSERKQHSGTISCAVDTAPEKPNGRDSQVTDRTNVGNRQTTRQKSHREQDEHAQRNGQPQARNTKQMEVEKPWPIADRSVVDSARQQRSVARRTDDDERSQKHAGIGKNSARPDERNDRSRNEKISAHDAAESNTGIVNNIVKAASERAEQEVYEAEKQVPIGQEVQAMLVRAELKAKYAGMTPRNILDDKRKIADLAKMHPLTLRDAAMQDVDYKAATDHLEQQRRQKGIAQENIKSWENEHRMMPKFMSSEYRELKKVYEKCESEIERAKTFIENKQNSRQFKEKCENMVIQSVKEIEKAMTTIEHGMPLWDKAEHQLEVIKQDRAQEIKQERQHEKEQGLGLSLNRGRGR